MEDSGTPRALLVESRLRERLRRSIAGYVESVSASAVNITCDDGPVTITTAESGAAPMSIVVEAGDLRGLASTGDHVFFSMAAVQLPGRNVVMPITHAATWSGHLYPRPIERRAFARSLARARAGVAGATQITDVGAKHLAELATAIRLGNEELARSATRELLRDEPHSDDLLVGTLAALRVLDHPLASGVASAVMESADPRNTVARVQLLAAAQGDFASRVHELVRTIAVGSAVEEASRAALGWGAHQVAGFITAGEAAIADGGLSA